MKNKLLTKLLLLPVVLLMGSAALAQSTVSGTVSDALGPVPGVNVIVKGTSNGAQTDFDGNYTINDVANDAVLVFSYIGYATQEVAVNGQSTINVTLSEDVEALSEVVVIGYGTTTVKDATGAVTAVTAEEFNQGVIVSPEQLIQGKTAGVQISQTSGEPGAGIEVRIRGAASIRSNNNPLYVVDGIPLAGGNTTAAGANIGVGTSAAKNPLNFLNPSDIESISILKDASAAAIYGSRGANGVVIVTTKSGRGARGSSWEVSSNMSISTPRRTFDLLNSEQFLSETARFSDQFNLSVDEVNFGDSTDWQDFVYRTTASSNNNIGYSNNYGTGNVRATFNYGKTFGVVENTSLERITGRINANQRFFNDKLKLGLQASISRVNDETAPLGASAGFRGDLLGAAYSANPTWPSNPDFEGTGGLLSPATALAYTQNITNTDRYLINFSAEYDILPELSAKVNLGYDNSNSSRTAVASARARNFDQGAFGNGTGAISDLDLESKLLEATLNYNKDFGNSNLDVVVGYSFQDFRFSGRDISGFGFFTEDLDQMGKDLEQVANDVASRIDGSFQQYGFAPNIAEGVFVNRLFPEVATDFFAAPSQGLVRSLFVDTFDNTDELQSFFGRINYDINDKYVFTATVRADGSSRFGDDNKYGIFPSGAFAWKMHNEDFVGDNVSTLKVRVGVGITGNQDGLGYGNFTQRQRFAGFQQGVDPISDGGDINIPGTVDVAFPNPELQWEETLQYALGFDFGFNNDRFSGSLDLYRKETTDLLFQRFSAQPAPQPFEFINLPDSKIVNEGIELAIGYDIIDTEDFQWNANFNIAYNSNVVEELDTPVDVGEVRGQGLSRSFAQRLQAGRPLFSFFLREFQGYDELGNPIFEGGIDNQKFVDKSALPDFTGGLTSSWTWKDLTLSAFFAGQFGHYIYNNTANAYFTAGAFRTGRNVTNDVLNTGESLNADAAVSTRFLEKGDFVRLQNLSLSYNWPMPEDSFFDQLVINATGQNLFVITDYTGLDPEVSSSPAANDLLNELPTFGIDYNAFPRPTVYTLGITAKF